MKALIIFLLLTTSAFANPFLVSDPSPEAVNKKFEVQENQVIIFIGTNEPDGSIKVDLSAIPTGQHTYQARYIVTDPLWGSQTSAWSVPFTFTRPSLAVEDIKGFKLVP